MGKSNKELAVDVALAFIQANSKQIRPNGTETQSLSLQSAINIIQSVYKTLENFDKSKSM